MKAVLIGVLLFVSHSSFSQWVRDDDSSKVWMIDGIYMSELEFLTNNPSYNWLELGSENWRYKDSLKRKSILSEVLANPEIKQDILIRERYILLENDSGEKIIEKLDIWGFCVNGIPYKFLKRTKNENFVLIHVAGPISYLSYIANYQDPFYWSVGQTQIDQEYQHEVVDLVVDFEQLSIYKNTRKKLEEVVARDEELYREYQKEKKKSKVIHQYIIRYNKRHPLTFKEKEAKPDK